MGAHFGQKTGNAKNKQKKPNMLFQRKHLSHAEKSYHWRLEIEILRMAFLQGWPLAGIWELGF